MAERRIPKKLTIQSDNVVMSRSNYIILIAITIIGFAILWSLYYAAFLGYIMQWILAIFSLVIIGIIIKRIGHFKGMSGSYGIGFIYIIGTKRGINFIDKLSKMCGKFWEELPMWGLVLGFGLLSYPLLKGRINKKTYLFGIISIILITEFVLPYLAVAIQFIQLPQIQSALSNSSSAPAQYGINYSLIALLVISIVTGFSGYLFFGLIYNAGVVVNGIFLFLTSAAAGSPQTSYVTNNVPGVAPIIPGIDLPLAAGIISLAIILIVHEFSHGVLARRAKVKLKSVGIVLLGIIPIGGFAEPNDKEVKRLDSIRQTKIFAAGISSNFVLMIIFFVLLFVTFNYGLPTIMVNNGIFISSVSQNYPAYGILKPNMHILKWNGYPISNISSLENASAMDTPGSIVNVTTNNGSYLIKAIAVNGTKRGLIGVNLYQDTAIASGIYPSILYFLYTLFAISFMLNFLVAVINLLPLPLFDGMWIYNTNIKDKRIVKILLYIALVTILISASQWLFYI